MITNIQSPGVYIQELDAFGNSIVPVATSIPAFIGYTEKTTYNNESSINKPIKIESLQDYENIFGGAPTTTFSIEDETAPTENSFIIDGKNYSLKIQEGNYILYNQLQLFFANGGGKCYIVSVGDYNQPILERDFVAGLNSVVDTEYVTLLVCPDATLLSDLNNYGKVAQEMLLQCETTKNRFCILDVYNGDQTIESGVIDDFRNSLNNTNQSYGAAYYPFINTNVVMPDQLSYTQITNEDKLGELISTQTGITPLENLKNQMEDAADINSYLLDNSKVYKVIADALSKKLGTQPLSGSMAGIYAATDNSAGVWKAPANTGITYATGVTVNITDSEQANLNSTSSGKSVNAIRKFTGRGILVWGARTLDSNNLDWRYISTRRLMMYIEQSVKQGVESYVFAPNTANTWASVKALCENFLTDLWKQGGLMGAKASDAFFVNVGLGSTMTGEDILNGIMNISIGVSPVHPAEFIIIEIQQQVQQS